MIPGYDPFATAGDCVFNAEWAQHVLEFVEECLTHVKGELAGTPLFLEDWQKAVFANLFGWQRPDGSRRYRECLLYVPRKNSKTTMAAAIVNVVLYLDDEPGGELYSTAGEREQARIAFEIVDGMIENEPELRRRADRMKYSIQVGTQVYRYVSADSRLKYGFNSSLVLNDELHVHKTRDLIDAMETSVGARRQPLIVHLTTADFDRVSICNEKLKYAKAVRDGVFEDESFLPVIYETSRDAKWRTRRVWAAANPNLGVSVKADYIAAQCRKAENNPAYQETFRRLHLNVQTQTATVWLPLSVWDGCKGKVDAEALRGRKCIAALDLSSTLDVTAAVLLFRDDRDVYDVLPFFWVPEENAHERQKRDKVPYVSWAQRGLIEMTPGNVVDYDFIEHRLGELASEYDIEEYAADPWNATQLLTNLAKSGCTVVEVRQGFKTMSPPMKEYGRILKAKRFRHGGNPVLRWMFGNLVVRQDPAGNIKPDKEKATEKIDGQTAIVTGLARWIVNTGPAGGAYKGRRLQSI